MLASVTASPVSADVEPGAMSMVAGSAVAPAVRFAPTESTDSAIAGATGGGDESVDPEAPHDISVANATSARSDKHARARAARRIPRSVHIDR